jgi:hypothetical protein
MPGGSGKDEGIRLFCIQAHPAHNEITTHESRHVYTLTGIPACGSFTVCLGAPWVSDVWD